MKKRNLTDKSLTTKSGIPLGISHAFKDRPTTAQQIEKRRNNKQKYDDLIDTGYFRHVKLTRTHETNNAIVETWVGEDVFDNTHILYLTRKPTSKLMEMRDAC